MSEPVRVKRIEVKGLFGLYDHTIDLKMEDRVTILHGPNGIGKTALLRMVKAALEVDPVKVAAKPFRLFRLECTDGTVLEIEPSYNGRMPVHSWPPHKLRFTLVRAGQSHNVKLWMPKKRRSIGPVPMADSKSELPEWLVEFSRLIPTRLIETQRLIVENADPRSLSVDWISNDLVRRNTETITQYGRQTQELSLTFPQRVLRSNGRTPDIEELRRGIRLVQSELEKLGQLGLSSAERDLAAAPLTDPELQSADPTKLSMIAQYVADQDRALGAFRELSAKVALFEKALASKLRGKSVRFAQDGGLAVTDSLGSDLPVSSLSSGEQHEIVLLYEMLFLSPQGTLLLIDEPEISMHIMWQKQFVGDIAEVANLVKLDVLAATHSPFIADERSDLMVALRFGAK
ncbi:MAG: AAA family ATPase [Polyangiaceae bacterium]